MNAVLKPHYRLRCEMFANRPGWLRWWAESGSGAVTNKYHDPSNVFLELRANLEPVPPDVCEEYGQPIN